MNGEVLDRLTEFDVEITADEVRKVTGFGEEGAKLIANLANQDGKTFSQAVSVVSGIRKITNNLGAEIAKKLPDFLKAPDAIIQLGNGRLNLFSTVKSERGNNGIISVELNSTKDIGGKYEDYNVIVTLFSSDDNYAQNLIAGDGVVEKYKREDLSQVNPQLYKWLAIINDKSSIDTSISQGNTVVKNDYTQNEDKYASNEEKRSLATAENDATNTTKGADSVTETPESEKITVDMDDETRADLLNKKSVNVVSVDAENTKALGDIDFDALQNSYPSYARPIIKKIARDFGILNEPFFNPDIELEFSYSGDSIQESINKQHSRYGDFVKMLSVFSDVIENAVGVETHKDKYTGTRREDTNLKQMYVLASAFSDEKGVYPVKLEVKEFKKNTNKLYLSVVLTKKESRYRSGNLGQDQLNTAPPTSTISISDLVGIVNPSEGDFLKYFPDSMLDSEQIEGKNKALAKDAEKIEKLSEDKKRSLATAENADAFSSTPETTGSTASDNIVLQDNDVVNSSVRADAENDTKLTNINIVLSAVEKTIKPEIVSNANLMGMLADKFGDNGLEGLANEIITRYNNGEAIGDFENLLADKGEKVYEALKGAKAEKVKYTLSVEGSNAGTNVQEAEAIFSVSQEVTEKLSAQVDAWLRGEMRSDEQFDFGKTPEVLKQLGAQNLPIVMNQNVMVKITGGSHSIGLDVLKDIPDAMADPIMIFKSDTVKNAFVLLTEHNDKSGDAVIIALHLNKEEKHIRVNRVASIYGKEKIENFIQRQTAEGNLKYINENKSQVWSQSRGLQLPKLADTNPDNNIILHKENVVNRYYNRITKKYAKVSYSIDANFGKNYDAWVKNGRPDRQRLTVGRTSAALQSIGVKDQKIIWDSTKISRILKEHKNMNDAILKQVPDLLENPVIVMQSLNDRSRIVVFGELQDLNGKPVLAVLELFPNNYAKTIVLDEIRGVSAYGKDNAQSLINRSDILYIDPNKNRTNKWLTLNRLQLPLSINHYGSVKRITYPDGNVNTYDMQNFENYSTESEVSGNVRNNLLHGSSKELDTTDNGDSLGDIRSGRDLPDSSSTYKNYTYDALIKKDDMFVTILDEDSVYDENGRLNRAGIIDKGIKNVRSKNNPKNTDVNTYVYVPDIGRDVLVTKDSLRHGLARKSENTAKATMKIGDILENSIRVNELLPRKSSIGGYVLMGVATDNQNNYYPVRMVVNNFSIEEIEVLDVLYAVNAKKRRTSPQTRQGIVENSTPLIKGSSSKEQSSNEAELSANAGSPIKAPSLISIAELLELVKNDFSDVLSNDVLQKLNVPRAKSTLSESVRYSQDKDSDFTPTSVTEFSKGEGKNEGRDLLSDGNSKRGLDARSGKQTKRVSAYKQKLEGKTAAERRRTAAELRTKGLTEEKIDVIEVDGEKVAHKYTLVKPEGYNDDMRAIVAEATAEGKEVGFFIGHAVRQFDGKRDFLIDGIYYDDGRRVLLRYDGYFSPQALLRHEDVHDAWDKPEIQRAKDIILDDLSNSEKRKILSSERYKDYLTLYDGDADKVWEEFVADVFAGMNDYTADYLDVIADYWYEGEGVDRYNPAEYNNITDGGGVNDDVLGSVGFGSETLSVGNQQLAYAFGQDKWHPDLPPRKLAILRDFVKADIKTSTQSVTDTTNWAFTNIDGTKVFVIYSTEHQSEPTLLYESKGKTAETEKNILLDILEEFENGKNTFGKSAYVDWVSGGGWLRGSGRYSDNNRTLGRGRGNKNVGVLQGQSRRESSGAFKSVIRNLIELQEQGKNGDRNAHRGDRGVKYTLTTHSTDSKNLKEDRTQTITDQAENALAEENAAFWDEWFDKAREYGAIPKGEKPVRDIRVPRKSSENMYVSQLARTLVEAGVTPDEAVSEFQRAVLDGKMSHIPHTDKEAERFSVAEIKRLGFDGALQKWNSLSESDGVPGKNDIALGVQLYNQCVNSKDTKNAMKIAVDLSVMATKAGQAVQSFRLLKRMNPDGQLYCLEKSIQSLNREIREALGKRGAEIELDGLLAKEYLEADTQKKREEALERLQQNIADQIQATGVDKWTAWRYLSMLANPRTHVRNIVGNAIFVPTIKLKDAIGYMLERGLKTENRTKAIVRDKAAVAFAKADFAKIEDAVRGTMGKYDSMRDGIQEKRTIFKTRWLEALRKMNFRFLEKEDLWFLRRAYVDSLAQIMTARGITAEQLNDGTRKSAELLDAMRAYAIGEAQRATFRDANAVAEFLSRKEVSKSKAVNIVWNIATEGVLPFKNTPLNIAKRAWEYSPAGVVTTLLSGTSKVRKGEMTANMFVDKLARGLTGTLLTGIGLWLAHLGLLLGAEEESEKKQKFDETVGLQGYALHIGDSTYTIDWAAPAVLPLFIGVELYKALSEDGLTFGEITGAISKIGNPLVELSCLQGVSRTLQVASYNQEDALSALAADAIASYLGQAIPSLGGSLARTIDKTRRSTYIDKNSQVPQTIERFIQQTEAKIPGASFLLQPKLDVWGNEMTHGDSFIARAVSNFTSPGYYRKLDTSRVTEELNALYERTGDSGVFPTTMQKYITIDKKKINFTGSQYTFAAKTRGQKSLEKVKALIASDKYKTMDDTKKVKEIRGCYDEALEETKEEFKKKYWDK